MSVQPQISKQMHIKTLKNSKPPEKLNEINCSLSSVINTSFNNSIEKKKKNQAPT